MKNYYNRNNLTKKHPYHYSDRKTLLQYLVDWGVVVGVFVVYFLFYNFGKITPSEMIKTTGLCAIFLLSLTLAIGPLSGFISSLQVLKAHRKFWGIASFIFGTIHFALTLYYRFAFDLTKLLDIKNPKFLGLFLGLMALIVLLIVTFSSSQKVIKRLDPKVWKLVQTASYLALLFALLHFYLIEQVNGALVIKRSLGWVTFWFAAIVIAARLVVLFFPPKKQNTNKQ